MVILVETVLVEPIQSSQARPLLRDKKYYIEVTDGSCARCSDGRGCCYTGLYFDRSDFQMDFTSGKEIRALFDTGMFINPSASRIGIVARPKGCSFACGFWSKSGCRLAHDVRPRICRHYRCFRTSHHNTAEFNVEETLIQLPSTFTRNEQTAIWNVAQEYRRYEMTPEEYAELDWDSILMVLQGHT
jgi:Fe-S-cluster containining protein